MLHVPKNIVGAVTAATLAIGLTACGGGGGGSLPTSGNSPTSPTQQTQPATAQMTINIPAKTSSINHRNPKYISASTESMTIGLVAGGKTAPISEIDLTPSSKNCSALAGGGTQCSATFVGQAGTATYALSMYSGTGGTGNLLSTGDVKVTLVAGQNTVVPIALDGVPATVALVLGVATLPVGTASSTGVFVQAQDASGNIIVGPGGFSSAISLAIAGDSYNTLALSSTSVASPGQVVTLNYTGGSNVGSTITPSIGNAAGTPATFAGSGAALTMFTYYNTANSIEGEPQDVAAFPTSQSLIPAGDAAIIMQFEGPSVGCCPTGVTIESPSGVTLGAFLGDTSDPYAVPAPSSTPGVTLVNGMSNDVVTDWWDSYDAIAVSPTSGYVYYSGYFSVADANTTHGNCSGSEVSGTLGVLNPSTGKLVSPEYILKGHPGAIKADSSGNIWFVEDTGTCNGVNMISTTYAIGELPVSGGPPIETPYNSALSSFGAPADMSISADGSEMYLVNDDESTAKVATAALASVVPLIVQQNYSDDAEAIATAPDGTTMWWGDCVPNENFFYGYVSGSKTFSTANLGEVAFPVNNVWAATLSYADGSFWAGSDDEGVGGIARVSGLSTGTPLANFYQTPSTFDYNYESQTVSGVSAGGGYVWGADDNYSNIDVVQYGAPSSGAITYNEARFIGTPSLQPNAHKGANQHHSTRAHRGRVHS